MVPASLQYLGWGAMFFDYDLDGWRDALLVNGHIDPDIHEALPTMRYAQRPLLFRQAAPGRFVEVAEAAGLAAPYAGRGVAASDYDNDGDLDLLITETGGPAHLLRNEGAVGKHWLRVRLQGVRSNSSGIGARLRVRAGGLEQVYEVKSGASYASQSDLRVTVGLGYATRVDMLEIRWPSGQVDRLVSPPVDRQVNIREGDAAAGRLEEKRA
jgi:hypothetical protein